LGGFAISARSHFCHFPACVLLIISSYRQLKFGQGAGLEIYLYNLATIEYTLMGSVNVHPWEVAMSKRVGIRDAVRLTGKSEKTIRRWVREGRLKDMRKKGDKKSPLVFDETELRGKLAGTPQPLLSEHSSISTHEHPASEQLLREHMNTLKGQIEHMDKQIGNLRHERDRWMTTAEDRMQRVQALEQELWKREHSGIRGLIKGLVSR